MMGNFCGRLPYYHRGGLAVHPERLPGRRDRFGGKEKDAIMLFEPSEETPGTKRAITEGAWRS